jgi:hypothetical protein
MIISLGTQGILSLNGLSLLEKLTLARRKFSNLVDGFEMLLSPDFVQKECHKDKDALVKLLSHYTYNTFHLYGARKFSLGDNEWTHNCFEVMPYFFESHTVRRAVVHPDQVIDMGFLSRIAAEKGVRIGIETLGTEAAFGNRFADIEKILSNHVVFDLVADTAHIAEMVVQGEPPLETYVARFFDRLKQIHFSAPGNLYSDLAGEEMIQTPHSLVSLRWKNAGDFLPCIDRIKDVPFTIEGVVPSNQNAEAMLMDEIKLLRGAR